MSVVFSFIMFGVVFGISLLFTFLTNRSIEAFLTYSLMFASILVAKSALPVWIIVALILGIIAIIFSKRYVDST